MVKATGFGERILFIMKDTAMEQILEEEYTDSIKKYTQEFLVSIFVLNILKKYSLKLDHDDFESFKGQLLDFLSKNTDLDSKDLKTIIHDFQKVDANIAKMIINILDKQMIISAKVDSRATEIFAREKNQWEHILNEAGG